LAQFKPKNLKNEITKKKKTFSFCKVVNISIIPSSISLRLSKKVFEKFNFFKEKKEENLKEA